MASVYKTAVAQAMDNDPTWLRYKGSILIISTGIAGILGDLADGAELKDTAVGMTLTVVATIIFAVINRFTKDGFTPSMKKRLETAGQEAFLDRVSESGITVAPAASGAPVTAAEATDTEVLPAYDVESTNDYAGEHRAGE